MKTQQKQISNAFPDVSWQFDYPLSEITYFKIGGPAEVYASVMDRDTLQKIVTYAKEQNIPLTLIGGASNIIVSDTGIKGIVLQWAGKNIHETNEIVDDKHIIQAEAGIKTALLVKQVIDLGYQGLEYFLGVPGTLGGAVYNNAHYLESLISEHIHRVEVLNEDGHFTWLNKAECGFGYDTSRFQQTHEVIVTVEFSLTEGDKQTSMELVKKATQYRAETQPLGEPSSGCIFQNAPITPELKKQFPQFADKKFISGGFLIDQAGMKGETEGDIEVSRKHAAFFINKGYGTAADVKKLINRVKAKVKSQFGVELQEEVFYLGDMPVLEKE